MWNMSKMWPTCKMSKELFSLTIIGWIEGDQDMVFAIIAESRRDCIVSSYWLWLLTRGSLRPNMGVLRMARSAIMETREDSNQHVFRFCGFCSSLVSVMGRLVGCMPIFTSKLKNGPYSLNQVPLDLPSKDPEILLSRKGKKTSINMFSSLAASSAC